jgi:hypothetical protein
LAIVQGGILQGLKPSVHFAGFAARLKPIPVTKPLSFIAHASFSAACKTHYFLLMAYGTSKAVPFQTPTFAAGF